MNFRIQRESDGKISFSGNVVRVTNQDLVDSAIAILNRLSGGPTEMDIDIYAKSGAARLANAIGAKKEDPKEPWYMVAYDSGVTIVINEFPQGKHREERES